MKTSLRFVAGSGYSGSDLALVCREAAMEPVKALMASAQLQALLSRASSPDAARGKQHAPTPCLVQQGHGDCNAMGLVTTEGDASCAAAPSNRITTQQASGLSANYDAPMATGRWLGDLDTKESLEMASGCPPQQGSCAVDVAGHLRQLCFEDFQAALSRIKPAAHEHVVDHG